MAGGVTPMIYLAHAIDMAYGGADPQVDHMSKALLQLGHTVYDPAKAWAVGDVPAVGIHDANLAVLERCHAMVWVFNESFPSIGTVVEATDRGRMWPGSVFILGGTKLDRSVAMRAEGWVHCVSIPETVQALEHYLHEKGI